MIYAQGASLFHLLSKSIEAGLRLAGHPNANFSRK